MTSSSGQLNSVPPDTKPARKGYYWDEPTAVWMPPDYLGWLSLAGMAGVPGSCRRPYFARYVAEVYFLVSRIP